MTIWDYLYFALVAVAILIWFAATVLYIDKKLRERRWRRRDEARAGYVDLAPIPIAKSFTSREFVDQRDDRYGTGDNTSVA